MIIEEIKVYEIKNIDFKNNEWISIFLSKKCG